MKKRSLKKLALLGLTSGLLAFELSEAKEFTGEKRELAFKDVAEEKKADENWDPNEGNMGYHLMTEGELLLELNEEGANLYNSLSAEGKELARKVASARCNKANECKGLNACKTEKNECAGKGACKGQGKCSISDKNLAVKLVAKKMAEKRAEALKK